MLTTRTLTNAGAPLYSPKGVLLAGVAIRFVLSDSGGMPTDAWDAATNERVGGDPVTVTTDAQGEFSAVLWPNTRGNRATKYKCRVEHPGFREFSGVVEDVPGPLSWAAFMAGGTELTPTEISQLAAYIAQIEAARDAAQDAAAQAEDAADDAVSAHVAAPDPHPQYAKEADLGGAAGLDVGNTAGTVAAGNDPRLSDARPPTGAAGGVLSGTYPNPGFSVDMATQAELDAVSSAKVDKVAGKGLSTEDYSTAEKNKLAGVATGATANATDAQLRDRATHTGTQAIGTVTGLQGALDAKAPLASPALTGVPSAPTAAVGTNTAQVATTAFAVAQIASQTSLQAAPGKLPLADAEGKLDTSWFTSILPLFGPLMPQILFGHNEQGAFYDPSDMSTLFQDNTGTVPVTAVEQPVGGMVDLSGRGNHATQATTTKRPIYSRRVNLLVGTETLSTQSVTTLAAKYVLSFWGTGSISLTGTVTATLAGTGANDRVYTQITCSAGTLNLTVSGSVLKAQLELSL